MKSPVDMRSILAIPYIYVLFVKLVRGRARALFTEKYIRAKDGDRILDIGCGTADILLHLPRVAYVGMDVSRKYVHSARRYFGDRGIFIHKRISPDSIKQPSSFDIVLAMGIIHHLNDHEAQELLSLARSALKPGGRLITLDGCYVTNQPIISRFILSMDRGRHVRTKNEYHVLASRAFTHIKIAIRNDLMRIPYAHIIMECTA